MILGSNGVDILEWELGRNSGKRTVEISAETLGELIRYYRRLTQICKHDWDYGSPIDAGICVKCGQLDAAQPAHGDSADQIPGNDPVCAEEHPKPANVPLRAGAEQFEDWWQKFGWADWKAKKAAHEAWCAALAANGDRPGRAALEANK